MLYLIALTGGPGGGKSTALPLIAKHFREKGYQVYTVPEIPTLFHANGVTLKLEPHEYHVALIKAAFSVHYALEETYRNLARAQDKPAIILADRGLVDFKAYCSSTDMWQNEILLPLSFDPQYLHKSYYHLVLHFKTAAAFGTEKHFTNDNNPARQCTPELARNLDSKTYNAWHGHPNRIHINNVVNFQDKVDQAVSGIEIFLSNQLCSDCGHARKEHGKQIPEHPPSHAHIVVCASLVDMDGTPSGKVCDCGGAYPQASYFDPGCFGPNSCGCPEFV